MMVNVKNHIPNFITCLNLLSGSAGVVAAADGHLVLASVCIGAAAVFDFFDGTAARLLKAKSPIGKELDSLADMISFGLLPGFILYMLMIKSPVIPAYKVYGIHVAACIALLIPVFSALRLAKFNLDVRQTDSFLGLPTPANALLIASFPLIAKHASDDALYSFEQMVISNYYFLLILVIILCWLLVSELPLLSLKVKNLRWSDNKKQFILLALSAFLLVLTGFAAVPLIIISYIIISLAW